jgi:hypothetical protein
MPRFTGALKGVAMGNKSGISKFIYVPRIIAIAYILLFLIFSLDAGGSGLTRVASYLMNALPAIVVAVCLAVFWRHPKICGWIFFAIAVFFTFWFRSYVRMDTFLLVSVPPLVIGALFLIAAHIRRKA